MESSLSLPEFEPELESSSEVTTEVVVTPCSVSVSISISTLLEELLEVDVCVGAELELMSLPRRTEVVDEPVFGAFDTDVVELDRSDVEL